MSRCRPRVYRVITAREVCTAAETEVEPPEYDREWAFIRAASPTLVRAAFRCGCFVDLTSERVIARRTTAARARRSGCAIVDVRYRRHVLPESDGLDNGCMCILRGATCAGTGVIECRGCGGDNCICTCGGEFDCEGCEDCVSDADDGSDDCDEGYHDGYE